MRNTVTGPAMHANASSSALLLLRIDTPDGRMLVSYVPLACVLSTRREHFTLHLDAFLRLEALEVSAGRHSDCAGVALLRNGSLPEVLEVTTSARAKLFSQAPSLNPQATRPFGPVGSAAGASPSQSSSSNAMPQSSQSQTQQGEQQQQRPKTFLEKYWMYIIPAVFLLMQASQPAPQQQQQQQGGTQGSQR